jgi:hypothetical protein
MPKSAADVIDICDAVMELASKSSTEYSFTKEEAAMAAEVKAEAVLYTLTTTTEPGWFGESFVRLAIRLFARYGIGLKSLSILRDTLRLSRQFSASAGSK